MPDLFSGLFSLKTSACFRAPGWVSLSFRPVVASVSGSPALGGFASRALLCGPAGGVLRLGVRGLVHRVLVSGLALAGVALRSVWVLAAAWVRCGGALSFRPNPTVKWDWPRVGLVQASFSAFYFQAPAAFRGRPAPYFAR